MKEVDEEGRARMVDVSDKMDTLREATARGRILMSPATLALIEGGGLPKGDVFAVAEVAGIMAAKQTSSLIPMCHPLPITGVALRFEVDREASAVNIEATARVVAKTGVEMEALVAVSVAALTIYDMGKSVDRDMVIEGVQLVRKSGGKSGDYLREGDR